MSVHVQSFQADSHRTAPLQTPAFQSASLESNSRQKPCFRESASGQANLYQEDLFQVSAYCGDESTALYYAPLNLDSSSPKLASAHTSHEEPVNKIVSVKIAETKSEAQQPSSSQLDLNRILVEHPGETFYCRVNGDAMTGAGIYDGDILIVDRLATPRHGDVVLAILNHELCCRTLDMHNRLLRPANPEFTELAIEKDSDFDIKGVVISSIRLHRECPH
jgi:DNA polymerase V